VIKNEKETNKESQRQQIDMDSNSIWIRYIAISKRTINMVYNSCYRVHIPKITLP